jgi:hypothetical protein
MKNTIKVEAIRRIAGIIALVAVIGLALTACPPEDDSPPEDKYTYEDIDIPTVGRMTFTGLSAYNGKKTSVAEANVVDQEGELVKILRGYKSAYNHFEYKNGKLDYFMPGADDEGAIITGGQVTIKVFAVTPAYIGGEYKIENYAGNDQVWFGLTIIDESDPAYSVHGYVQVTFANGIASGAFVPD